MAVKTIIGLILILIGAFLIIETVMAVSAGQFALDLSFLVKPAIGLVLIVIGKFIW